ncbi:MAG: hypothetical protein J5758_05480, partial [Abditibacteriota bacterium]|nr:hypothetical protein [Abditibacteriota bacterium]
GVNYMPSSGVAELNGANFEHYVSRAAYDPEVILMDLQRICDLGMNAVSVFIHASQMDSNNMLDLIDLCEGMDIYVDLSLRSNGDLFMADRKLVKQVMDRLHLSELDNIICYDTAWEPRIGSYEDANYVGRKGWDGDWERWITEQYGSAANAEKIWGTPVPRDENGKVRGVTDEMLDDYSDKYLKMVNAYRRFIDDRVARLFTDTYNYWREQDPNHLVSFRMSMSGSADQKSGLSPRDFCYDFQSLAPAVDVMEPEGYALRYESDQSMRQVLFANAYARYVKPQAPVVWKEFGRHMWSGSNFNVPEAFARDQEEYYRRCLDYMYRAYTSGMFCWFFPGGHRLGENSDYGILNPDGSDRPCTALLRQYASLFINQAEMTALEHVFTIDRDDSPRGIHGIFEAVLPEMTEADQNGESFGFRNKSQIEPSRIRYADDLTEDTLCGGPAGKDPFKYINGMIKSAAPYRVGAKRMLRVEVINTGLADWRAGSVKVQLGGTSVPVKEDVYCQRSAAVELPYTAGRIRLTITGIPFGPGYEVK